MSIILRKNRMCLDKGIPFRCYSFRNRIEDVNERQRLALDRFRQSQEQYAEQFTNLKGDPTNFMAKYSKAWSAIKPLNSIKDTPWTFDNLKMMIRGLRQRMEVDSQRFDNVRHTKLGSDVGAAHFVVYRRGAIKFYGEDWIRWTTEAKYNQVKGLPLVYTGKHSVEAIDVSNVNLHYEGLENFKPLKKLKELNLSGNKLVDDWYLDVISNFDSIENLGLCNCPGITHRGIAILYKMDNLKYVSLKQDKELSREMKLALLNLLDYKPDLKIDVDPTLSFLLESEKEESDSGNNEKVNVSQ